MLIRLRIAMLNYLGFPALWLRWPLGVWRGVTAMASPLACLSSFEYWTRHYYEHVAQNFKTAGRLGYVWDEAMGVPFGPRIYNNTLTYRLFGALSPRAFRLLTLAAYLGTIISLGILTDQGPLGLALALLLLGSPLGLHALVGYMLKPEVPWWSLALIAVTTALGGYWGPALAAGGILLLANASVAAITAFLIGPLWIYAAWTNSTFPGEMALVWLAPGGLKTLVMIFQARTDGMGRDVAVEQKKVARRKSVSLSELAGLALWFGVPLALCGAGFGSATVITGVAATLFLLGNAHVAKVADNVTVLLALLTLLAALALVSGEWMGLAGIAWFAYYRPFGAYPAMVGRAAAEAHRAALAGSNDDRLRALQAAARDFPWFSQQGLAKVDAIDRMLDAIPEGARVLLESDGDGRGAGSHLHFRNWADARVAPRQVELVNQFFLARLVEPALADLYLDRFGAKTLDSATLKKVCVTLGVSHVLAFTTETVLALEGVGFKTVASVRPEQMATFADVLHMPTTGIVLLTTPGEPAVIEPAVAWTRNGNTLRWLACSGEEYLVRYRYHQKFVARQGEMSIAVAPITVIDGLPLRFMRVKAVNDGPLQLQFRNRWLG